MIQRLVLAGDHHVYGLARYRGMADTRLYRMLMRMGFSSSMSWKQSKRAFERRKGQGYRRCFVLLEGECPIVVIRYHDGDGCAHLEPYLTRYLDFQVVTPEQFTYWNARFQVNASRYMGVAA